MKILFELNVTFENKADFYDIYFFEKFKKTTQYKI